MSVQFFANTPQINEVKIRRALISLSDKTYLKELCSALVEIGCELVGTSSTQQTILGFGYACTSVDNITQFPEILGGRVKTLHPKIFGAILGRPNLPSDQYDLEQHNMIPFDLVVCNLYPFQNVLARGSCFEELIENIDIGGVSLLRAAAKNHTTVSILCDPLDYLIFIENLKKNKGYSTLSLRKQLAVKAFKETAAYDQIISASLNQELKEKKELSSNQGPIATKSQESIQELPQHITLSLSQVQSLRYGENPHQKAAFYRINTLENKNICSLVDMKCFHGKELSYNNVLDIEHVIRLSADIKANYSAVIVKHNTPCGVGISQKSALDAYTKAFEADPVSPFGGIVCINNVVSPELANKLYETFLEVIIAPSFSQEALDILQKKKNLRLATYNAQAPLANQITFTHVQGGFLAQTTNNKTTEQELLSFPTQIKPDQHIIDTLLFAMSVVKHVRSNAIAIVNQEQAISIAGGFTNRVDAVKQCINKAILALTNSVLASDAFFPFPDSIDLIHEAGIHHIIQPGGSVQDAEVIKACDKYGISMTFTSLRHFKH